MSSFTDFIHATKTLRTRTAIVLGSGLGSIPRHFEPRAALSFGEIPGLTQTSVVGHLGRVEVGICCDRPIIVFHGRLHYYEGHSWERVSRPIEFAAELGIRQIILTNAAGGIHEALEPGSLMQIRSHLSWQNLARDNLPCALEQESAPYSPELLQCFQDVAAKQGIELLLGVYAAVTGPCYETPAEIRALRQCGADAVGMSTAHEMVTARRLGMQGAAISCITNRAAGLGMSTLNHHEVLDEAARQSERFSNLIEGVLTKFVDNDRLS